MKHTDAPNADRSKMGHSSEHITELRNTAIRIAQSGAEMSQKYFRAPLGIELKADESPVTQADRAVEAEIRRLLQQDFPGDGILGEEFEARETQTGALWVIDPIDGTRSFISGHPLYGLLLGRMLRGQMQVSVVSLPALDETYVAARGHGSTLNGAPLTASTCTDLNRAMLYINEGEKIWRTAPDVFARLMDAGSNRRFSYDCAPYMLLAAGHIDAVVDCGLQPYDVLPVSLLVKEAGGVMTDWNGQKTGLQNDVNIVAAATPELHAQLLALLVT